MRRSVLTAPHLTSPHRTAPHRTSPHRTWPQAREPKKEARRFINDTVRNDFHRKFLYRYIK